MKAIHLVLGSLMTVPFLVVAACGGTDSGGVPSIPDNQEMDAGSDASVAKDSGTTSQDSGTPEKDSGTPEKDAGSDAGDPDAGDTDAGDTDAGDADAGADAGDTDAGIDAGPSLFKIKGTVLNAANAGLVIQQNGGDDLTIAAGATTFEFATSVATGSPYAVTISSLPNQQACKVTAGAGNVGAADVTDVVIDCGNRTSCKTLLADIPGTISGNYLIDVDGANAAGAFVAYCDMTFDDGQGGGAGGWTLIEATKDLKGPTGLAVGAVTPGVGSYLDVELVKVLATASTQVHLRTAGDAANASITSVAEQLPILNLRQGLILTKGAENTDIAALFTGPMASAGVLNFSCTNNLTVWPSVYHACGNAGGLHLVGPHSVWHWQNGDTSKNIDMEVYVR